MPWADALAVSVTPAGSIAGDLVSYIASYGVLGVFAVILGLALYKGWRFVSPQAMDAERRNARADLERENDLLRDQLDRAETQRDQLIPVVTAFTGAVNALLPLLQSLVSHREDPNARSQPRRDRR